MKHLSFTLRFSAVAASIGILCLGASTLFASMNRAEAHGLGPEVTGGSHPYVSLSGLSTGQTTIYTVPSDRIFVVTAAVMNTTASLYQGTTLKVNGTSRAMVATSTAAGGAALNTGNAKVVFDPGSTVVISGGADYFISGYLAHP